jgi:hypothetical protein
MAESPKYQSEDWKIENIGEDVAKWAKNTAVQFVIALRKNKIGVSQNLMASITYELTQSGGDVKKVMFKFLRYGRFVDMGVGREFARGAKGSANFSKYRNDSGQLKNTPNRKPKPWYSKTAYREIKYLSEHIMAEMDDKVMDTLKARFRRINTHSSKASN